MVTNDPNVLATTPEDMRKLADELEKIAAVDTAMKTAQVVEASTALELLRRKMTGDTPG